MRQVMNVNNNHEIYNSIRLTQNNNQAKMSIDKSETSSIKSPGNSTVEISEDAQRMYLQSLKEDASTQEKVATNSKNADGANSPQGALNAMLAELQDKLKKLLEKIERLRSKGDEESLRQADALEAQAASLKGQIAELVNQKMELSQSSN